MLGELLQGREFKYEVYLCKPYSPYEKVACLSECIYNRNIKKQMQNINEFTFDIAYYWNDLRDTINENFDLISVGMVILLQEYIDDTLQHSEYYHIYQTDLSGGEKEIKTVSCYSLQYRWNKIKIKAFTNNPPDFVTTRKIYDCQTYDIGDGTKGGILDYILQVKLNNTWSVSYISPSLANVYRTFDISEKSLFEVAKDIQDTFNCVFFFDTYNRTIAIKSYDELPTETGLIISSENYLKNIKQQVKIDEIVTRLYVEGNTYSLTEGNVTASINSKNITGQAYLDDFTFFRTSQYMSQSLMDALTAFDAKKLSYAGAFASYLSTLSTKNSELTALNDELSVLEGQLDVCANAEDESVKLGGSYNGQTYAQLHAAWVAKKLEVTNKESQIASKESEISVVNGYISTLNSNLSYDNVSNFTTAQLQELLQFINEDTVKCETESESDLLSYGQQILAIKASPPIEFSLDMVDILSCQEENYTWDKLTLGSQVDLLFDDFNISEKPRIVEYSHNPDSNSLSITVSNKTFFNDALNYVSAIFAQSKQTSTVLKNEQGTYKDYQSAKDNLLNTSSTIDTTKNIIDLGDGSQLGIRGMYMRALEDASGQMRILEDRIVFTKNNWSNYSVGITSSGITTNGSFKLFSENTYGSNNVITIDGNAINIYGSGADSGLKIYNKSDEKVLSLDANGDVVMSGGTFTILKKSGATTKATISMNATDGFKILNKDNTSVFSLDVDGNITMQGSITITGGTTLDNIPNGTTYGKTTINGATGAERSYSALGASSELVTKVVPQSLIGSTPNASGLYLGKDYMGFYSGSEWKSYIDNSGNFLFKGNDTNKVYWNGSVLTVRGQLNATDIVAGTLNAGYIGAGSLSTSGWTGSGNDYIVMQKQMMYFVENASGLTKMAMGFLPNKSGTTVPLIVLGAGDGNGNNRGYIEKDGSSLALYYTGTGSATGFRIKDGSIEATCAITVNYGLSDQFVLNSTNWNAKLAKADLQNPVNALGIVSENVGFNYALGSSKGGNAADADKVGGTSSTTVLDGVTKARAVVDTINSNYVVVSKVKPNAEWVTPPSVGLYYGSDYLGYYSGSAWTSYIKGDGTFKFAGDGTHFIEWTGSALNIQGTLNACNMTGGSIAIGASNSIFKADGTNGIWLGNSSFGSAKFSVSLAGAITARNANGDTVLQTDVNGNISLAGKLQNISYPTTYLQIVTNASYSDLEFKRSSQELFKIYDGVTEASLRLYGKEILITNSTTTIPQGTWDFGSATVSNFYARFG